MISTYSSDIIPNWNDMRTNFGYKELSEIKMCCGSAFGADSLAFSEDTNKTIFRLFNRIGWRSVTPNK